VAQFGSEGLFAFDMDGRVLWKKDLGVLDSGWFYDPTYQWGFSSSPVISGDSVIAQVDIQKGSFIAAWDLATNAMAEVVMATPAISDGVLLVRTLKNLYGLGESAPPSTKAP
jgi:hypothetical protein